MTTYPLKFKYKPKALRGILLLGLLYVVIGILSLIKGTGLDFFPNLTYFGVIALGYYYYWKTKAYVSITEKGITKNRWYPRHISWEKFNGMRYYTDSIKLLRDKGTFDIDKQYLSDKDLKRLDHEIKLRLPINQS